MLRQQGNAARTICTPFPPTEINHAEGLSLKTMGNRGSEVLMFLAPFQLLFEDSNVIIAFKFHQENGYWDNNS